jgi:tetratricopeptide (TPR) repeat protein
MNDSTDLPTPPLPPPLPQPSFQPRIPPPPPLPPAAPKKKGRSGCIIALIVAALLLVASVIIGDILFSKLSAARADRKKAKEIVAKKTLEAAPSNLNPEQQKALEAFGQELATALSNNDGAKANELVDTDALFNRVLDPDAIELSPSLIREVRTGMLDGMKDLSKRGGMLFSSLTGSSAKVLRTHNRGGKPTITLRIKPADGGTVYVDVIVQKHGASFKVIDLFNYTLASTSSLEAQQNMLFMLNQSPSALAKVLGIKNLDMNTTKIFRKITEQHKRGDFKGAIETYKSLSFAFQRARPFFIIYLFSLQSLTNEPEYESQYKKMLALAPEILGPDSTTGLLAFDLHFLNKDFKAAHDCLLPVLKAVGEDSMLHKLRGTAACYGNDLPAAEESLRLAEKIEPDLLDIVDLRMEIAAVKKDYQAILAEIKKLRETRGIILKPEELTDSIYEGFRSSPELKAWQQKLESN